MGHNPFEKQQVIGHVGGWQAIKLEKAVIKKNLGDLNQGRTDGLVNKWCWDN